MYAPPAFSTRSASNGWIATTLRTTVCASLAIGAGMAVLARHHPEALLGLPLLVWGMARFGLLAWAIESFGYTAWLSQRVAAAATARSEEALRQAFLHPDWPVYEQALAARVQQEASIPFDPLEPQWTDAHVRDENGQGRVCVLWQWRSNGLVAHLLEKDDWWAQGFEGGMCINPLLRHDIVIPWTDPALWPVRLATPFLAHAGIGPTIVSSAPLPPVGSAHHRLAIATWARDGAPPAP